MLNKLIKSFSGGAGGKLVLAFLFFIAALVYVYTSDMRAELQLVLRVNIPHGDTFQLFIDKNEPLEIKVKPTPTGEFQPIRFLLPREKIDRLRLNLGVKPAVVGIKDIAIRSLFKFNTYTLTGKRIQKLFHLRQGVKKNYIANGCYYVETGPGHWIAPGKALYRAIGKLQADKTLYYLLSIVLTLVFFYFLHFLNLKGLRTFWSYKVLVDGVLVFLLIISFPLANRVLMIPGKTRLAEKRKMAREPELRLDNIFGYSKDYSSFYNDHFVFRSQLIYLDNLIKVKFFGVSPVPKVLVGKKGWLFLGRQQPRPGTLEYYRSITLFTDRELEQWKNILEQRKQWLAGMGCHYLFMVAPNKNTIYPEYMPDRIRRVHRRSRMDQLKAYLEKHSTVPLLDLRQALIEAKKNYPVYLRTDTHWSEYGAYIAHREIMKYCARYFKGSEPVPLSRYKIGTEDRSGGDLAMMLYLHQDVLREDVIRLEPVSPSKVKGGELKDISKFVQQGYMECRTAPLPNILMVHDSFYKRLKPFLGERFSRIVFIWDWDLNFYPEIIEREKPKLVIDEMAERFFMGDIPKNPKPPAGRGLF